MSLESFIRLYQELLTMIDPDNDYSVQCAVSMLHMLYTLAHNSGKASPITIRAMDSGVRNFENLARHRNDFAGKPGDYKGNNAKRQRLKNMLVPSC